MSSLAHSLVALLGMCSQATAQLYSNSTPSKDGSVKVQWLDPKPAYNPGTTFGVPWPRGRYQANDTVFTVSSDNGESVASESWITGYWADSSVKWTAHAITASAAEDGYTVHAGAKNSTTRSSPPTKLTVKESSDAIEISTGKITATFGKTGSVLLKEIKTSKGQIVGQNGKLILRSQSSVFDDEDRQGQPVIDYFNFESKIDNVTVSKNNIARALVTMRGDHRQIDAGDSSSPAHKDWLPFVIRFYLYANSESIRIVHSLIYDGVPATDFVRGIGLRFDVPLADEFYNRHIRIAGVDGGILNEAVQGITGLRRDPGQEVRTAQYQGKKTPALETWDTRVSSRLKWIPTWNDYALTQLSSDGFTLKKRTQAGQSWINIPGSTRAGGLAYLGGATKGGLAVGLKDFWKQYPSQLDISNATTDTGAITVWLYSPSAQPLDTRPFHDGLGQKTYADQLDALEITYEDWEGGYDSPYGIAKTSELFLFGFDSTPESDTLATLTDYIKAPPVLIADRNHIAQSEALGTYWQRPENSSESAQTIEDHLNFLTEFYRGQVSQRKWYGFWDHGDVMHTYDVDRHEWRYDVGGYAWDNSELSPNLFFWGQFLRTGQADLYRFAEAHTRHTGETDVYHLGPWKGLGTRHGVLHWSDSSKQIRISQSQYRKVFYYLTGGDERVGKLLTEILDAEKAFLVVDPRRKVRAANITYVADPEAILIDVGLDWSGQAAAWLIEWERRGPRWQEAKSKLLETMKGIANLKNGFVTGEALYNLYNGTIRPPSQDPNNQGVVGVSHLTAVFGLVEVIAELTTHFGDDFPADFEKAWLDYCYYFSATQAEQQARYGKAFGKLNLYQGHSRLTAYAANKLGNATLAARAWSEFYSTDGFKPDAPWKSERIDGSKVLFPVDEAAWVSTNDVGQYGLAAIENLALIGEYLE
ncbi:hypothetical protein E4T38_04565 [Aureobasidium subglaciale]|nr:hypothetical protein E4T38_04565 [Aureobasidium subglaciale]KAI5223714.1 hypothetical protein E4T40_04341 [Aureobasidium subglaciale]KAI5227154.1 hypothetical protein E4T41_04534 [Aureobasidium subglaciale]KAI5262521.1 hypothetical protein E4T46_04420 [Aureobasidium subglaciale]